MNKNTSISLGDHFNSFILKSIDSGRYSSVSEVMRAGLRLLEEQEKQIELLNEALEKGESSGKIENFDANDHLKELHKKHLK